MQIVPGGGFPAHHQAVELKMTFKDSGAYDFHSKFVQLKERMQQALEVARESSQANQNVNMDNVHLEQLPAYEASTSTPIAPVPQPVHAPPPTASEINTSQTNAERPSEPPPGYEEVQRETVAEALGRDLRIRDP